MYAGAGIAHSERTPDAFRRSGGVGHGIRAWTVPPEALEESAPRFQRARAEEIPRLARGELTVRVLVGAAFGARSPIETSAPVLLAELRTGASAGELQLEARPPGALRGLPRRGLRRARCSRDRHLACGSRRTRRRSSSAESRSARAQ